MSHIEFKVNGTLHQVDGKFGPDVSLNEYLRTVLDLRGTKAMCHEGGCGACVVTVRAPLPPSNELKTFSVNSCLVSVLSCHGWEVTTVEGIGNRTIGYHEIQSRLAKFNGTQCGYCTPGWVMNMHSLYESRNKKVTSVEIENSFASNICRCTGYRPIADAFKTFASDADERLLKKLTDLEDLTLLKPCGVKCSKDCTHKKFPKERKDNNDDEWCILHNTGTEMIVVDCGAHIWYKAFVLDDVFKVMANGDYKLVAGNTGQGVYHVTNYPRNVIDILNISELKDNLIDVNLILGAGTSLSEMMELFLKLSQENKEFAYLKNLYDHMDLVAHIPVRNIGTIGGNLCLKYYNKEFPSDIFLLFETVGAMVTVAESMIKSTTISLPEFLKIDMTGKILIKVLLPPLSASFSLKTYKIMPVSQNAHAIVNAGCLFQFHHNSNLLEKATIVFGGISPEFIHATKTEKVLIGRDPYSDESLQLALKILSAEIVPKETPPEPSAAYRKMLAIALYYKAILFLCPDDKLDPKYRSGGEVIKRNISQGTQAFDTDKTLWPLNQPVPKLEALVQCSGESTFANDLPTQTNEVFCAFVTADITPGSIINAFDTTEALQIPGVIAFYSAKDIPGNNSFTPTNIPFMTEDEEILCSKEVKFYGQPVGIIVAYRANTADKAAGLVKVEYASVKNRKPLLSIEDVLKSTETGKRVVKNQVVEPTDNGVDVKHVIRGDFKIEGQYHYYMEPQTCVVKPTEDGMEVYSSTQWLDLTNVAIAQCLQIPVNSINVIVRRVGGAYGGKISRSSQVACAAALVSHLQGKPCRFVLSMQTNMKIIGKRLPTYSKYEIGSNSEGEIQYLKNTFYQDTGYSFNETMAPNTVIHFRNCYDSKRWYIEANSVATDTPSNTWCRAPCGGQWLDAEGGGLGVVASLGNGKCLPVYQAVDEDDYDRFESASKLGIGLDFNPFLGEQLADRNLAPFLTASTEGVAMIEYMMERIAYDLGKDPLQVRLLNMNLENNPIPQMIEELKKDSNYDERLDEINKFNNLNRWRKRAIKLIPLTVDIFYFGNYNSIVSIYHGDGSVLVIHGGIEIGQGINTKVAQVCAYTLGIPLEKVSVKPSTSFTSPNVMTTGGSIGSECVSFATIEACKTLLKRLEPLKKEGISWDELITKAFNSEIDLQASYMFSSLNDNLKPYDVYAVCSMEVEVDILTGNHDIRRVYLLEDTGRSLSPEIDIAQIEGAFVMGLGYWTSEKLVYDPETGKLLTDRTWTYKPPGIKDIPADMRVYFRRNTRNEFGVLQSKATGEPALCLATVLIHALRDALRSARLDAGYEDQWVHIDNPCTVENIFMAVQHKLEHYKLK